MRLQHLVCVTAWVIAVALGSSGAAQEKELKQYTADELGVIAKADKWDKEFSSKELRLRVAGQVEDGHSDNREPFVYLKTQHKFETGQPVKVSLKVTDKELFKKFKAKDKVVVEGKAAMATIFGPRLDEIKLIKKG